MDYQKIKLMKLRSSIKTILFQRNNYVKGLK